MSDVIKQECGLAFIRLRKPFSYYLQKYGTVTYGLNKLYLLMEKQHNRGQDGAGIAAVKYNVEFCHPFIKRDLIPGRNLAMAGNFNLVNTEELFALINIDPGEFQRQSD